jgi:mRNA-degrading endonuclease YafQ of YafQ-DinJ toxin-antitoxin module
MLTLLIRVTARFERNYKKLPKAIKEKAKEKEKILRNNPFDVRLETHKLHGREEGVWAFWVNRKYRIKFIFLAKAEVLFLDIGTHDIYQ